MSWVDSATCAAPCAGIIRFRFRRSAGWCPPSQPSGRAPVLPILARGNGHPCHTCGTVTDRHERARSARLYLVCGDQPDEFLARAFGGGVDIVQLRMKEAGDDGDRGRRPAVRRRSPPSTARCSSSTTAPTWSTRPAPTGFTSARTTPRSPTPARSSDRSASSGCRPTPPSRSTRRSRGRRLHRRRPHTRDADQAGSAGGRARAGALRRGARDRPVLRDRRDLAGERRRGPRRRRGRGSRSCAR